MVEFIGVQYEEGGTSSLACASEILTIQAASKRRRARFQSRFGVDSSRASHGLALSFEGTQIVAEK